MLAAVPFSSSYHLGLEEDKNQFFLPLTPSFFRFPEEGLHSLRRGFYVATELTVVNHNIACLSSASVELALSQMEVKIKI